MAGSRGSTGPDPQDSTPADAPASAGGSRAGAAWDELRQAVGADDVPVDDELEGAEDADPELIAEAERIADEALAEARAKEAAEGQAAAGQDEAIIEADAQVA